jgi:S1-C subfamily serine protease
MKKQARKWLFSVTAVVLTASFFSYGYKVLASESQIRKEIEITTRDEPEEKSVFRIFSPDSAGGFLGVELADIAADDVARFGLEKEEGVRIVKVEKTSPAGEAGMLEDDIVLSYAGQAVLSAAQFRRLVTETPVGRKVAVGVLRNKKKMDLTAKIGKRETVSHAEVFRNLPALPNLPNREFRWQQGPGGQGIPGDRDVRITVRKPRLGISAIPMTEQLAPKYGVKNGGVLVTQVNKDSVAEKAGVLAGDVITEVDGIQVTDLEDIARALDRNEGRSFEIKILREMKPLTLKAQLPDPEQKERKSGGRVNL